MQLILHVQKEDVQRENSKRYLEVNCLVVCLKLDMHFPSQFLYVWTVLLSLFNIHLEVYFILFNLADPQFPSALTKAVCLNVSSLVLVVRCVILIGTDREQKCVVISSQENKEKESFHSGIRSVHWTIEWIFPTYSNTPKVRTVLSNNAG